VAAAQAYTAATSYWVAVGGDAVGWLTWRNQSAHMCTRSEAPARPRSPGTGGPTAVSHGENRADLQLASDGVRDQLLPTTVGWQHNEVSGTAGNRRVLCRRPRRATSVVPTSGGTPVLRYN